MFAKTLLCFAIVKCKNYILYFAIGNNKNCSVFSKYMPTSIINDVIMPYLPNSKKQQKQFQLTVHKIGKT